MLKKIVLLGCLLFGFGVVFAQKTSQKTPLVEILTSIEKQHDVKFSYSSSLLTNIYCFPFSKESTVKEKLENLRKQTFLEFKQIDDRYIVISEKKITNNHRISGVILNSK